MATLNRIFQEDSRPLRLFARLRQKQLSAAIAGHVQRSAHYARLANRVRRQMSAQRVPSYSQVA